MTMIKISSFGGMIPRLAELQLPDTAAIIADNIKLQSGCPTPMHVPTLSYVPLTPKTLPPVSIFKARSGTTLSSWFTWPFDVDCVRVPLATDVEARFCWTGDGAPKFAKYSTAITGGGDNYPNTYFDLGIPTPQTAAGLAAVGGTGAAVTRYYQYTFFSQDGEESAPSPLSPVITGKVDSSWNLSAMDTAPTNSGTGTATATTFTNAASAKTWLRVGDEVAFGSAPTVFRTVTALPSAASFSVTGASIAAETTWARRANWNTTGMTRRIYRTSGSLSAFLLVVDNLNIATTTYSDTILDANILGDELITVGWIPPPVGLTGLCLHSSGALIGFVKNILHFSEPLQPHAWVTANQLSAGFDGIGIATYGATVVFATAGNPFVAEGIEPASMTGETVSGLYPCLSKRSVISIGNAVLYASKHGLIQVGSAGTSIFSDQFYTRDEWEPLNPDTMICETSNGRIYVRTISSTGSKSILVFDGSNLTRISVGADELYADTAAGELYIGSSSGISLWDSITADFLVGSWLSKEFSIPKPVNMGVAKIEFEPIISTADLAILTASRAAIIAANAAVVTTGKVRGCINSRRINYKRINGSDISYVPSIPANNEVIFSLYGGPNDALLATKTVTNTKMFRLPSGYKHDEFFIEVSSQCQIEEIRVAETPDGLKVG